MSQPIDLRSDTVTKPTEAMRRAMAAAEVGDDVLGDDPTVNALERATAELLGKEAAVYMPSGTMTNQVAIRSHTEPGDEVMLADSAHVYFYEAGAPAALSGVMCKLLATERGIYTVETLKAAMHATNIHFPKTTLVTVENTSNRGGGSIWPMERIRGVHDVAREAGLSLHLDGARIWNASVAAGIPERDYAQYFDSVSVCFSKGLGAPVGSCLVGSAEFIGRARRFRKMFGGGMRQVGIIAAGALYALQNHRDRLAEDHANARALGEALTAMDAVDLDPATVETNIIIFRLRSASAPETIERLAAAGVLALATGPASIRLVTNMMVDAGDVARAIEVFREVL